MDLILLQTAADDYVLFGKLLSIILVIATILGILFLIFIAGKRPVKADTVAQVFQALCKQYNLTIHTEIHQSKDAKVTGEYIAEGSYQNNHLYLKLHQTKTNTVLETGGVSNTTFTWHYEYTWKFQNPHNIHLVLSKESLWDRVDKTLGRDYPEDIITYNEEFDKQFIVICNHASFPLEMLHDEIYNQLVKLHKHFGLDYLEIKEDKLIQTEKKTLDNPDQVELLATSINATAQLIHAIQNFSTDK